MSAPGKRGERALFAAALLVLALWMLAMNRLTPLMMDDYDYSFSWATGERLRGIADVAASQAAHYRLWGGRSVAHFLAQLFLWLGKPVFVPANALMYALLLLLMLHLSGRGADAGALLLANAALLGLPFFGTVFLWLDGACNYLWCTVIALLPLLPLAADRDGGRSALRWALFAAVCFLAGWTSENTACGVLGARLLWTLMRSRRGRVPAGEWISLAAHAAGIACMLLAPGNFARASRAALPLLARLKNAGVTFVFVCAYAAVPAGIVFGLLAAGRIPEAKKPRVFLLAAAGLLSGLAMLASPEFSPRTLTGMTALLTAAALAAIPDGVTRRLPLRAALAALCLAAALIGLRAASSHRAAWQAEEDAILAAKASGAAYAPVRDVPSASRFTMDIRFSGDPEAWPERTMGKYFGIPLIRETR